LYKSQNFVVPFALSLSKDDSRSGFDKLSTNGKKSWLKS